VYSEKYETYEGDEEIIALILETADYGSGELKQP
jgi:hypothetical protein